MATLDTVRINQLSADATDWLRAMLQAMDDKDVERYASYLSDDVEVVFNNGDLAMSGREAVAAGLAAFWQSFESLRHEELNIYGTDDHLAHEALNHYRTLDGRDVVVRAVAWIDRDGTGRATSVRIYHDRSPLEGTGSSS